MSNTAGPALADLADKLVNGDTTADVHPNSGFIEDEQLDRPQQSLRKEYLLLVTARIVLDISLDAQRLKIKSSTQFADSCHFRCDD